MKDYVDVYFKRLNRYGNDFQTRMQHQREREFEGKLLRSVYRVDFNYGGEVHPGTLEKFRQDETQTLQYLLTRVDLDLPCGTVLMIPDKDGQERPWMVYWLESMKASGYNRYIVLKMTHRITWTDRENQLQQSWAYFYGQENNMLMDEIRSRSRNMTIYAENLKLSFLILPVNPKIRKDDYFELGEGELKEGYRITGYDRQSTPGVEYVSADPVYLRDQTPMPEPDPGNPEGSFWLDMGR